MPTLLVTDELGAIREICGGVLRTLTPAEEIDDCGVTVRSTLVAFPVPALVTIRGTVFTVPGDRMGSPALNCNSTFPRSRIVAEADCDSATVWIGDVLVIAFHEIDIAKV